MTRNACLIGLVFVLFSSLAMGQSQQVSFIHGLGDNSTVWNTMSNELQTGFDFSRYDVSYNSSNAISNTASNIYIPYQSVVVAHSMGGLVAREYLRQHGTNQLKALITVGTPHVGAPAAAAVQNGTIKKVSGWWLEDLMAGPYVTLGSFEGFQYALYVATRLGINPNDLSSTLDYELRKMFANVASVDDMKPSSTFLNNLNASPSSTLPAAKYAIFGREDSYNYVRLFDSAKHKADTGNPLESGQILFYHRAFSALYLDAGMYYTYAAGYWLYRYYQSDPDTDPFYFTYYDRYQANRYAAEQWFRGFLSLVYWQQMEWDKYIVGVRYFPDNTKDVSDGLLPGYTQAPPFMGMYGTEVFRAYGANHLEETVHPSVKEDLEHIFQNDNVNINKVGGSGSSGDTLLPPPPPPLPDCGDNKIRC